MASEYSSLPQILEFLVEEKHAGSWQELAGQLRIQPAKVSRLKNGKSIPSSNDLNRLSELTGLHSRCFRLPFDEFKKEYEHVQRRMAWELNITRHFSGRSSEFCDQYAGQYVLYTQRENNQSMRSLFTIRDVEGVPKFQMVNPYYRSHKQVSAFEYTGYAVGAEQFIYFVGEQTHNEYELIYLAFYAPRGADADLLRGIMSGVGVRKEVDYVASVPAVLVRTQQQICNWRDAIGSTLGLVQTSELREDIQRHLVEQSLVVR